MPTYYPNFLVRLFHIFTRGPIVTYRTAQGFGFVAAHSRAFVVWDITCFLGIPVRYHRIKEIPCYFAYSQNEAEGLRAQQRELSALLPGASTDALIDDAEGRFYNSF
jgi:hypothetical protein